MSTQEKSGGTLSSAFTKGEYTYRRRGSAVATGDIRITDPKSPADLNTVTDPVQTVSTALRPGETMARYSGLVMGQWRISGTPTKLRLN